MIVKCIDRLKSAWKGYTLRRFRNELNLVHCLQYKFLENKHGAGIKIGSVNT